VLRELGVAAVYTPKDFGLTEIMGGIVEVIREANGLAEVPSPDPAADPTDETEARVTSPR